MNNGKSSTNKLQQKKNGPKTLGPVSNLEEHVLPEWWRSAFGPLYLKTDGDVVDDPKITRREVDLFFQILKPSKDDRILDLCCGQGRHCFELVGRGFEYVEGLDRSHYLIQRARAYAKKENSNVKFREGDARKLPYSNDTFDVITILGNSFGYFETMEDDLRVLKEVYRVLKPWGRLLIDVADGEYLKSNYQPRSWEWIDKKQFVCRERSISTDSNRLISREVIAHVERGVVKDQFYAERLYTKQDLEHLLEIAGFTDINLNGEFSPNSNRNQDLGMMEKRIIVTSNVRKEWSPTKRKIEDGIKNVVVILGDPNKPDPLKPASKFDDDDFYTIDQLKAALRELKGYQFTYLNNHDTLLQDLMGLKGKVDFVLNLCDEGYCNDPIKEPNIPFLLETIGISYTGSSPQCLVYCYDKSVICGVAKEIGVPVPKAFFIKPGDTTFEINFDFPIIVKPNFGDSSFGITQKCVTNNREEIVNAISEIRERFGYDKPVLVEEFLTGKDLSVGIIGNLPDNYNVLPIIEEDYSCLLEGLPRICGYEAKWLPDSPYWNIKSIPAELPEKTRSFIIEQCLKLFERLECRDYCRFDWRLDRREYPKLLEVNPNPGWCWDGHLAKMARIAEMSYTEMLGSILQVAERRLGIKYNGK